MVEIDGVWNQTIKHQRTFWPMGAPVMKWCVHDPHEKFKEIGRMNRKTGAMEWCDKYSVIIIGIFRGAYVVSCSAGKIRHPYLREIELVQLLCEFSATSSGYYCREKRQYKVTLSGRFKKGDVFKRILRFQLSFFLKKN